MAQASLSPLLLIFFLLAPTALLTPRVAAAVAPWWAEQASPAGLTVQRRSPPALDLQAALLAALPTGDLCPSHAGVRDLCQQCAKVTKDPKAFRMCCSNTREARTWCASFLDFGLN
ncbi:uncharacterized protein LOC142568065 [Dermacentor variabilis]|uniref:uncharacterized protein LOC142568065 n=1 Tax=Dermacentor variabilis TaxID=34621 RepID=UPI003F5BD426